MFHHQPAYIEIQSTKHEDILLALKKLNVKGAHFTNGTFAYPPDKTIATTLAGFKYVLTQDNESSPLIIAVNSDVSMKTIGKEGYQNQYIRSQLVAAALAETFPNNKVIVLYYDEKTPNELYDFLSQYGMTTTLHKWGYGTAINDPKIEGAEKFKAVYAYTLPDDLKPICWEETTRTIGQQQGIQIVDLRNKLITSDRKCLFELPKPLTNFQSSLKQPEKHVFSPCT